MKHTVLLAVLCLLIVVIIAAILKAFWGKIGGLLGLG